jgi:hypothetical protein
MGCALVLHPDGDIRQIDMPGEPRASLDVLYTAIGCRTVNVVRLTTQVGMWIDNGGPSTQPPNLVATALARLYGRTAQIYHGPAVIAGVDDDGTSVNLTGEQAHGLLAHLQDATGPP